ncbi:hypothetical protein HXX01_04305, partial [Candidatus Nomurabacteria bacterium]|nr:hypothetical protein [Candidatus Nomurabacteria bacterium]
DLTLLTPIEKPTGTTIDNTGTALTTESKEGLSGREMLAKNLAASVGKAKGIMTGPMSIWIILLIIVILLGGGYAVYSLLSKKETKETLKQPAPKPITPNPSPVQPPLSATVNTPPSVTSSNNPNPQGQIFGK